MVVRVEIRDRAFNILEILDNEFMGLSWGYNRTGGCAGFSFSLPREFCNEKFISGDFNIRIYVRNETTKAYDIWFQGVVEDKIPNVVGEKETIAVQGHGYQAQLSRIYVDRDYTSTEVSAIVKDILDNDVVPNTDIIYSAGDIVDTGFTPDSMKFNTDALSAIQTLADLVGTREWGVDSSRSLFFKARSSAVGFKFPLGGKVSAFNSDDSFKDIVNKIVVQGGDVAGVPFTATYNSLSSQTKYGLRTKVYQNSAITTAAVATQFADSIFAERNDVVRRGRCSLVGHEAQIEATVPIPLFVLLARGILYGEKNYGTFLYSGEVSYQVNRISYKYGDDGSFTTDLEVGKLRPDISESIGRLEYQLEQERSASL